MVKLFLICTTKWALVDLSSGSVVTKEEFPLGSFSGVDKAVSFKSSMLLLHNGKMNPIFLLNTAVPVSYLKWVQLPDMPDPTEVSPSSSVIIGDKLHVYWKDDFVGTPTGRVYSFAEGAWSTHFIPDVERPAMFIEGTREVLDEERGRILMFDRDERIPGLHAFVPATYGSVCLNDDVYVISRNLTFAMVVGDYLMACREVPGPTGVGISLVAYDLTTEKVGSRLDVGWEDDALKELQYPPNFDGWDFGKALSSNHFLLGFKINEKGKTTLTVKGMSLTVKKVGDSELKVGRGAIPGFRYVVSTVWESDDDDGIFFNTRVFILD